MSGRISLQDKLEQRKSGKELVKCGLMEKWFYCEVTSSGKFKIIESDESVSTALLEKYDDKSKKQPEFIKINAQGMYFIHDKMTPEEIDKKAFCMHRKDKLPAPFFIVALPNTLELKDACELPLTTILNVINTLKLPKSKALDIQII